MIIVTIGKRKNGEGRWSLAGGSFLNNDGTINRSSASIGNDVYDALDEVVDGVGVFDVEVNGDSYKVTASIEEETRGQAKFRKKNI